jgi:hypothetical protein
LERQLKRLDPGFQFGFALEVFVGQFVELVEEVELGALLPGGKVVVPDVFDDLFDVGADVANEGALERPRQEGGASVLGSAQSAAERNEAGEILVLRAEPVECPRAHRGFHQAAGTGIHHHRGKLVGRDIRMHRIDHGDLIDHLADLREDFTDFDARLALFGELELGGGRGTPPISSTVWPAYLVREGL